eukprot:6181209-Pleurochrysis_carterae.AAC.1
MQILTLYTGILLYLSKKQTHFSSESQAALSAFHKMWAFNFFIVMLASVRHATKAAAVLKRAPPRDCREGAK